jgi:ribosomal protein S12 methylthiotransferase
MELQQSIVERRRRAEVGNTVRVMVDGPSADSPLVWTARLEGQAPEIDSVVVLTDCDPSTLTPGTLVDARILSATGYDLVAQPLPA